MADAPKEGGGSSWGPFEIGVIILLLIALTGSIEKGEPYKPLATKPASEVIEKKQPAHSCGISVTSPSSNEYLSGGAVLLRGITDGCLWKPDGSTILFVQVINAYGAPLSDYIKIESEYKEVPIPYVFEKNILLFSEKKTKTGTVILVAPHPDEDGTTVTLRIPVRFGE